MSARVLVTVAALTGITGVASAAPVLWSGNGHYYDVVLAPITWDDARLAAASSSWLGVAGHLATVTSAAENVFLTDTFGDSVLDNLLLGGIQTPGSPEPSGGWTWITGEAFVFEGWRPGEPNNFGNDENIILFAQASAEAFGNPWNDGNSRAVLAGYVIEYPVPSPSGAVALGLAALVGVGRRRRPSVA